MDRHMHDSRRMVRIKRFAPYANLPTVSSTPRPNKTVTRSTERTDTRLTEASYIVLGLLDQAEPATPYDLKQLAQLSTNNFWSVPHTQLYTECARLAGEGLLDERQEQGGRRRRTYRLTRSGRKALEAWRDEPIEDLYELRDASTLKLFFGGDPAKLASTQLAAHKRRLELCEQLFASLPEEQRGPRTAIECGIGHEREFIRFWERLARETS
jgi:PadR family transcriptional regulator, regulatory protein AphA